MLWRRRALGRDWDKNIKLARTFMDSHDTNDDKAMCLEGFSLFCEEAIYPDKPVRTSRSSSLSSGRKVSWP